MTDTASASTTWSSSPSAPSAANTKRSAPSAAATGTEESVASPTAAVIDPSPMLRSHDASWASWARSVKRSARRGTANAVVSTSGSGRPTAPDSSSSGTKSTSPSPSPP